MVGEGKGEQLDGDVRVLGPALDLAAVNRLVDAAHAAFADELDELEAIEQHGTHGFGEPEPAAAEARIRSVVDDLRRGRIGAGRRVLAARTHGGNSLSQDGPRRVKTLSYTNGGCPIGAATR